jgi:hypothetical protein
MEIGWAEGTKVMNRRVKMPSVSPAQFVFCLSLRCSVIHCGQDGKDQHCRVRACHWSYWPVSAFQRSAPLGSLFTGFHATAGTVANRPCDLLLPGCSLRSASFCPDSLCRHGLVHIRFVGVRTDLAVRSRGSRLALGNDRARALLWRRDELHRVDSCSSRCVEA